jgi:prepilin-type N-terminal cleavage/methylation domain-containing protein
MFVSTISSQGRQRGDTLVEVLIAIAVVTLVLGGAYVTTNRSLLATRSAQERGNALKNAESQIEQLKGLVASSSDTVFAASVPFCISSSGSIVSDSSPECTVGTNGSPTTTEPAFHLSITRDVVSDPNTFVLTETWTDVGGQGGASGDRLQLRYRLYE